MNEKQKFYSQVQKQYPESEISTIIGSNPDCDYYELCQSFVDIALNAPKCLDGNKLSGAFQDSDIDCAKKRALIFLTKYSVNDIDEFFRILENQYPSSTSSADTRKKSALIKAEHPSSYLGYFGTLYDFRIINDEIFNSIVEEIKEELTRN